MRDTGHSVICRKCRTVTKPANIVDGTLDENRTGICRSCGGDLS